MVKNLELIVKSGGIACELIDMETGEDLFEKFPVQSLEYKLSVDNCVGTLTLTLVDVGIEIQDPEVQLLYSLGNPNFRRVKIKDETILRKAPEASGAIARDR